jgi:hypothetical protein
MGLVLRKDIGTKLTIADLDNNFEYLGMDSNDIDLYWGGEVDNVIDSIYVQGFPKTFTSKVYKLGVKIKNYNLIENHNPELIIERFKKNKNKRVDTVPINCPSKFRQTYPYSDYVADIGMRNIDSNKTSFLRPMIIPITSESDYYRIYAENYFSQKNPPKVSGCKENFYTKSNSKVFIYDDTNEYSLEIPKVQRGSSYCRLSVRISDGFGGYLYSKPLVNFKIKMTLIQGSESIINYDYIA